MANRAVIALIGIGLASTVRAQHVGYQDTPLLPGGKWHVHDGLRPQPKVIDPGDNHRAPSDAVILFDGHGLGAWHDAKGPARWESHHSYFEVKPGTGSITTNANFGDFQLHAEFATPDPATGTDQGRGNSGIYLFGKYEVQVLDNYGNKTYPDGQAGALYGQYPPMVNACRPPGQWQTYDILFNSPVFDGDRLVTPGYVTVIHNGVVVQNHRRILGTSAHRELAVYEPHPPTGPITLQDHGHRVRYRNMWIRPMNQEE